MASDGMPAVICWHRWLVNIESEQVLDRLIFTLLVDDSWLGPRCVVVVACLPPLKPGAVGTAGSTHPRSAMPSALRWLLLPFLHLWCPRVSFPQIKMSREVTALFFLARSDCLCWTVTLLWWCNLRLILWMVTVACCH